MAETTRIKSCERCLGESDTSRMKWVGRPDEMRMLVCEYCHKYLTSQRVIAPEGDQ